MTRSATSGPKPIELPHPRERESVVAPAQRIRLAAEFYAERSLLIERAAQALGRGLAAGDKVVAIVPAAHAQGLFSSLTSAGLAVDRLQLTAQLVVVDSEELLSGVSSDDEATAAHLQQRVAALVAEKLGGLGAGQALYAYNELPALLWERGNRVAAVEAEGQWEELQRVHPEKMRGYHALAGFFKSWHGDPDATAAAPCVEELQRRAEIEDALREALARSRSELASLRGSEEQQRDFLENGALGLHRVSADGTILWANRAELELLGYAKEEYVGHSIAEFHLDATTIQDILARLTRGETLHDYEARLRAKDGSIKHVLISSSVYRRGTDFVHTRCFTRDVTERRRAEEELRASEERLQRIADALPVLISFVDGDLRYQFVNATYERWFGLRRAEILGKRLEDVLGADVFARAVPHLESALSGTISSYEAELPYLHGGTRSVQATYLPDFDSHSGKITGYIGLVSDISERRGVEVMRAAAALRAEKLLKITAAVADAVTSTQVFEAVVDHVAEGVQASSVGLWLLDPQENVARWARGTGYSEHARRQLESLPLDSAPSMPILDALRSEAPVWIPSQEALVQSYPHLRDIASKGRSYRIACLPLVAEQRAVGVLGITIEEPGEANEEERDFLLLVARYAGQAILRLRLLEAEQRSRREALAAYEQAVDARARAEQLYRFAQAVVDADRVEVVYDAAFVAIERALGTNRAAILRADRSGIMRFKTWRGLSEAYRAAVEGHNPWPPGDPAPAPVLVPDAQNDASLAAYRALFQSEGIGALAFVPLVSNGRLLGKFMLYYAAPHLFTRADIETARAIANHLASVTVRYETVATLEETIRNNELLAGVLAHDLRNPLAAIMTAAHLLLTNDQEERATPWNAKALGKILSSGGRMKAMIEQLLDFTRARSGGGIGIDPKESNLAELSAQALDELELTNPTWRIDRHFVGDPVGHWDSDRMLQVVSNLASNAGQHGRAGGIIRVTVDGTEPDQVVLGVHNEGVVAAVDPQELFDPFRSFAQPRSRSRGVGLGLFIVKEIVKAHGGTVEVVSSEKDGTSFIARLPRRAAQGPGASPSVVVGRE